ncbi:MAG TPA: hypothetical protein VGI81_09440 [Tepidisphaeraceae bacterium]|jgi:hypothetical protein
MQIQRIEIQDLDKSIVGAKIWMSPDAPKGSGILKVPPYQWVFAAIRWAWLQWKARPDFEPIAAELSLAVQSTLTPQAIDEANSRSTRDLFDWFVCCCAVLSGDSATLRRAADATVFATSKAGPRHHYYQALAGIIRARVEGDPEREREQLAIAEKFKPTGPHVFPSRALLRAFVDRDYAGLQKEAIKGAKKHWTDRYMGKKSLPVLIKDEPDHIILNTGNKDVYSPWPYVEAVFAKLAILDGAKITYDEFWFPLKLVSTWREPSGK